jgi:hypothetical protein
MEELENIKQRRLYCVRNMNHAVPTVKITKSRKHENNSKDEKLKAADM